MQASRKWVKTIVLVCVLMLSMVIIQQAAEAARLNAVSRISFLEDSESAAAFLSFDPFSLTENYSSLTSSSTGIEAADLAEINTNRPPIRIPFRPPLRSPYLP